MATQYAFVKIVTDGLVSAFDAADRNSYPGSGTTWRNLVSNNNGTLTNSPSFSTEAGGCIVFDGTNDSVSFSNPLNQSQLTQVWTVQAWVNITTKPPQLLIGGLGAGLWIEYVQGNNSLMYLNSGVDDYYTYGGQFTAQGWVLATFRFNNSNGNRQILRNLTNISTGGPNNTSTPVAQGGTFSIGSSDANTILGKVSKVLIYNRYLSDAEIEQNYNAQKSRFKPDGSLSAPFLSPVEAQTRGYLAGSYYFKSGAMSSPLLLEYQPNYYEGRPFCCVFRSPYRSAATTNRIDLNIPMGGLLVQRDTLDLRGAVYWSTPITYNSVGGNGNNTADSGTGYAGSNARRVMLGFGGGHGIYNSSQQQCNWGNSTGGIGAGWDGVNCGVFPNDLVWGTGNINPAYENRSGTWSHWITWN